MDTTDPSSRLFVKNLPPTITEAELRKHFSTKGREVTDVKLIQRRRIGYIGYKTAEEASKAVKFFNRTYIRMSRISVEPAKAIADPTLPASRKTGQYGQRQAHLPTPEPEVKEKKAEIPKKKRKREDLDPSDPKLKEYLDMMRTGQTASSKLEGIMGQSSIEEEPQMATVPVEDESDEEYESIPTRQAKRQKADSEEPTPDQHESIQTPVEEPALQPATEPTSAPIEAANAADDDDWLRSRTNRLLDLVDPDDLTSLPKSNDTNTQPKPQLEVDSLLPETSPPKTAGKDLAEPQTHAQPAAQNNDTDDPLEKISRTSRLYARNLPFRTTEKDLRDFFEKFGEVDEAHVPVDRAGTLKGFAFISFVDPASAIAAYQNGDGKIFQGRLLHILPAEAKRANTWDEVAISKLPLKQQNLLRKKREAKAKRFTWNSLLMNQDAVLDSTADRIGISKSELLDPTSADAAVRLARAETEVIQDAKAYFLSHGVNLDAFKSQKKGDTAILVKNFGYGTTIEQLRTRFEEAAGGHVLQVLMPPSKTIAIVQISDPAAARTAYQKLAYARMGTGMLFLEKAPENLFADQPIVAQPQDGRPAAVHKVSVTDLLERPEDQDQQDTTSLYVKNLNFNTTTAQLSKVFKPLDGFVSAQVKTRVDPKKPGQALSMGFGFVHFRSKAESEDARKVMDGTVLQGHTLSIKSSHKGLDAAAERRKGDRAKKVANQDTKIVIKNLAFEINKRELKSLLKTYGELKVVRIPKKLDNTSRGFAFVEFSTPREAENCIASLNDTHFLGRKLVLDYAEAEAVDAEEEIAKMQKKIGGQVNKVALQQLTGRGRQKVNIGQDNDE